MRELLAAIANERETEHARHQATLARLDEIERLTRDLHRTDRPPPSPGPLTLKRENRQQTERVFAAVTNHYGIQQEDLGGRDRRPEAMEPRLIAMYLTRELTKASLPAIGRALNRDHSTVLYGVRRAQQRIDSEPAFAATVSELRALLAQPI